LILTNPENMIVPHKEQKYHEIQVFRAHAPFSVPAYPCLHGNLSQTAAVLHEDSDSCGM
jgi:hypothetical protein